MDVQIKYIKKSEIKKLLAFNRRNYRAGHILLDKQYIDWQFGSFPAPAEHYTILGIFDLSGGLLGVFGLTVLDYLCFGRKIKCASLANLMIDKNWRNLGLGYRLLRQAEKFHPLAVDHGLNEGAIRLFEGRGWVGNDLKRYAFVLNGAAAPQKGRWSDMEFVSLKRYDARLEALFKKIREKYPITVRRSKQYLNWRYFNHPLIAYNIFAVVRRGAIVSFMVLRLEGPKHFRAGRIIDFISLDRAEKFSLAGALDFCRQKKARFVDYYFSGTAHVKSLKTAGFADASRGRYARLPKLLNPVVKSAKNNINFFVAASGGKDRRATNTKYWYTTKGGGDQDRAY